MLEGESLKQRLRRGPLSLEALLSIAADVVRALVSAHMAGIIHRDIAPGNIFITQSGTAKLLDFGLAKALQADESDSLGGDGITDPGIVPGTVHYLAPEQLLSGIVDRRADLWGLGTVLYEAATGARPFDARTKSEVIAQIVGQEPMPLRRLTPSLPVAFDQIVMRLLEKHPERRYQRAGDLLKDLDTVRGQAPQTMRVSRPNSPQFSVAVLPFSILGDETEDLRSFRDDLSSDIAWALQQMPGVRVAARTSTESLRGQSIRSLGEQLDVERVLEGTVQSAGGRFRVIATLLASATEAPLNAPVRIDLPSADVLAAQDEAARQVVAAVRSAAVRLSSSTASNSEAFVEYQRGLHAQRGLFAGGWSAVIEHATRASEADPRFAPAHVMQADTYNTLGLLSLMKPHLAFQKARLAAERALLIDDTLATAHAALGLVRFGDDWDWNMAETHFRRALELDPDLASARVHYSWLLGLLERGEAAIAEADRAVARGRARFVLAGAALTYFMANRYDEALALCNECLEATPDYVFAVYLRGQCYHMKGMYPTAHAELERAAELGRRAPFYLGLLGRSYGEAGLREKALGIVAELDALQEQQYVAPHCYVYVFYGLGERERALLHQEDAYRDGGQPLNYLSPYIRNLFSLDPTHRDRLRQMRLNV
jgi:serine/threonine-protein kinase